MATTQTRPFHYNIVDEIQDRLKEVQMITKQGPSVSKKLFSRVDLKDESLNALNHAVNVCYTNSYQYHAMKSFCCRDTVSLPGHALFFNAFSLKERERADHIMNYISRRGGFVQFLPIPAPEMNWNNEEHGDALYLMQGALAIAKKTYEKLLELHEVGGKSDDPCLENFVEDLLQDQTKVIKRLADYVTRLNKVGKGHGHFHFDKALLEGEAPRAETRFFFEKAPVDVEPWREGVWKEGAGFNKEEVVKALSKTL